MQLDVAALNEFYATPLGQVARRVLAQSIRSHWRGERVGTMIGLGFATPFLASFRGEASRLGAMMPETQGALVWPRSGPVATVLVEEERLPLPDNTVDRLLLTHCLEVAGHPGLLLRELWRVLTPEGRLLIVVPSRRGLWTRIDSTPFGQGRPYSRWQLEQLLVQSLFTPLTWSGALYFPPLDKPVLLRSATAMERAGNRFSPRLGGVILVEAKKVLVAPLGKPATARALGELVTVRRETGDEEIGTTLVVRN